jgi:hypothetical protein
MLRYMAAIVIWGLLMLRLQYMHKGEAQDIWFSLM